MKYIRQLAVIFSVTCVAEILKYFIPLPIPASIYGLVLMFCRRLKRRQIFLLRLCR